MRSRKRAPASRGTILVTGAAGFIGSHLTDRLIDEGYSVLAVDNLGAGRRENVNPRAVFHEVDIADARSLERVFVGRSIDYCINEAAKINTNVMLEDPHQDVRNSVTGTLNLLQLCARHKVKKFLYASSVSVYGRPKKLPAAETDPTVPIYSYGIAKKCAEEYVRYFADNYGINYSILRYGNVYGPRQPIYGEVGVVAIFTQKVLRGERLVIYGDGTQLRDYLYVGDAVEATFRLLTRGDRSTFNVACGRPISVNELYRCFSEQGGGKLPCDRKPKRIGELGRFYSDIGRLRAALRWAPKVSIRDGIRLTLDHGRGLGRRS